MSRLFFLILLLFSTVARAETCRPHLVMEAPLRLDALFFSVPVMLDGHEASMLLDTGSEGSLVTPEGAGLLKLPQDRRHLTMLEGGSGRGTLSPNLIVSSLRIGTLDLGAQSMPLGALPGLPLITPPILGLLGGNIWRGLDLELDAPHHVVRFWSTPAGCADAPDWAGAFTTLPARRIGDRLLVPFVLDGVRGMALVDSGARSHIVSRDFAHRLGVSDAVLARDPGGVTSGVDLHARLYAWHRFGQLRLGNEVWDKPVLTVSMIQDGVDMLLGADWFARRDVWLAYASGRVFVRGE
ncbi:pepsin/retropepsin-like aspartic protease family protein [Acidomonas methanolica]|uniref:Peptidase A2 domain-containing protein n=1 Tax=Acidomonas methanolica NBRC 104435 TaxID=1231351 RepID=A0A023D4I9_ACIMT|nr:pepsin/retropepsin-like aspartic protease family protein [Acidomonas methanolica]MBU2653924.1 aspartyl protease family protein [Acidomonas methanolica]TCS30885.1 aspartyl protease [Acidomonas methanolica]GAJ28706.1 hypothetical protein Amme_035_035 [Acidomonas methanolica NBRC 104435]GBQ45739.1 hypothetical protein AA0498_0131 [Acidomonas methanolica]GEK98318.1 hypothetical protein AME01nite_08170 [Acidomonas methanolica NBRC 104435]